MMVNTPANVTALNLTASSGRGVASASPPPIANSTLSVISTSDAETSTIAKEPSKPVLSPEELRDQRRKDKLHFWIYALVNRLQKNVSTPTANESLFVKDGKAEVVITLTARNPETLTALKVFGFELVSEKGKTEVLGRIPIEKLAALADIDTVKLVLPKI